ncbi:phosphoglycerate mutase family protein [Paenibacillus chitinolyticus]|uniref:phosphoglycerate mutase family protein n=1 Tax=Paenibacillus chitinolyticus TaxID=79263 RepID=UPI0038703DDF
MEQTIYLIRHGETVLNSQGRYQGELDSPLTSEGIKQVKQVSKLLKIVVGNPKERELISSP